MQAWKRSVGVLEEEVKSLRQKLREQEEKANDTALASGRSQSIAATLSTPEAGSACLDALAAEHERSAREGLDEAACELLGHVRCHQLASALLAAQCGSRAAAAATARAAVGCSRPLQAVASFLLGPLLHAQPGSLRAALGAQACAFVCREVELRGGQADTRAALTALIAGGESSVEACTG